MAGRCGRGGRGMLRDAVRSPSASDARSCGGRMKSWHGWRLGARHEKSGFLLLESCANCLEVCRELG
ncbi:MAG: hypothetical protein ACK5TX_21910, partial [Planctomyces sp.]